MISLPVGDVGKDIIILKKGEYFYFTNLNINLNLSRIALIYENF